MSQAVPPSITPNSYVCIQNLGQDANPLLCFVEMGSIFISSFDNFILFLVYSFFVMSTIDASVLCSTDESVHLISSGLYRTHRKSSVFDVGFIFNGISCMHSCATHGYYSHLEIDQEVKSLLTSWFRSFGSNEKSFIQLTQRWLKEI